MRRSSYFDRNPSSSSSPRRAQRDSRTKDSSTSSTPAPDAVTSSSAGPADGIDGENKSMRFAVIGAGGIGGYFGAGLSRAGHEVRLLARGEHLEAIRSRGLEVREPEGTWI